jgi:hypothetical protein
LKNQFSYYLITRNRFSMFARTSRMKGIIYSLLLLFLIVSCRKHKDSIPIPDDSYNSLSSARITGIVKDQTGTPVTGVTITAHGKTAVTGTFGEFNIESRTGSRVYVKAEKNGYFTGTATEVAAGDGITNVQIILAAQVIAATFDASAGGTAQDPNGNEVSIPSDGIVTTSGTSYSGDVNVSLLHLDPTSPDFGLLTQGADMVATNAAGAEGALYSYGVLKVELTDNSGNELQLAAGKTSTIRMTIPSSQLATAPATIPLWYFDENAGQWIEDGFATKTGNEYVGTVTHFTDWNCDVFSSSQATITGKVIDCNGKPVPFASVRTGQSYAYTDQNGVYTRRVPSGIDLDIMLTIGYGQNYTTSSAVTVSALSPGQTATAPDLVIDQCLITVTGQVIGCEEAKINGYVKVNDHFSFMENGSFSVVVSNDDPLTITAYDYLWGFTTKNMAFPSGATTVDAGTIIVCVDYAEIGETGFTIDGFGFANQTFTVKEPDQDTLSHSSGYFHYSAGGYSRLYIYINGNTVQDPTKRATINIQLPNTATPVTPGDMPFASDSSTTSSATGYINIYDNNTNDNFLSESGTLTITRIDTVGGLIEGTFTGSFRNYANAEVVSITNGKFSTLRYPDSGSSSKIAVPIIGE